MSSGSVGPLCRETLLGYFEDAYKPRDAWLVGMELEKMGRDTLSGAAIPYDGAEASVRRVIERYHERRGGHFVFEGHNPIGIDGGRWGTISLEPAGQVEWSSQPFETLTELEQELREHLVCLDAVGMECGVRWLDDAVEPDLALDEMPWMPKARYGIMRPYLGAQGRLAHRMMTQTASIQCAFDFESDADWSRKFRAAALLSPVAVALFANSPRIDGRDTGFASYRTAIWRETDPARCGLPAAVFEDGFGIERWVSWLQDVPAMFLRRGRGLAAADGVPFRELLARRGCASLEAIDWELHLSGVFTDVRSYRYIEVRTADLVPDDLVSAVPALWTGLLYHADTLREALDLGAAIDDHGRWETAMMDAARRGLDADFGDARRGPRSAGARRPRPHGRSGLRGRSRGSRTPRSTSPTGCPRPRLNRGGPVPRAGRRPFSWIQQCFRAFRTAGRYTSALQSTVAPP